MKRRANGEGTLYTTTQKLKKKFDNTQMCNICMECTDRSLCNNRTGWIKCQKCKDCQEECLKYCDRFNCYRRTFAQVSANKERKSIASGKTRKEVNAKKTENLAKIANGKFVNKNDLTLLQVMKNMQEEKLKYQEISENTYIRNMSTINAINKTMEYDLYISNKKIQELTEQDIKDILLKFTNKSQSELDKAFDILNVTIRTMFNKRKIEENIMLGITRTTFVSSRNRKKIQAFSIDETKQIIDYIDKYENELVDENRSSYDNKTIKNFIKLAFASAMRCGELGALDFNKHINLETKKFIVERTLTKDKNGKIVIGIYTKTGRKKKQSGQTDTRIVPFDILFSENEVTEIVKEQIEIAKNNPNNKENLLFCKRDGTYINHSQITDIFKRICRSANVKMDLATGCHIHMTKHTCVTRLIESSMSIYAISKLVGTTIEVLQRTYAHILDSFVDKEIQKSKKNREETTLFSANKAAKILPFRKSI